MVLNGTLRVLLGLLCLCLCLRGTETQGVDQNALVRIIRYIQTKYSPKEDGQYAVAIYVPVGYCSGVHKPEDGRFLKKDEPDKVKLAMNGPNKVYEGEELIAATRKDAGDGSYLHSECLLLKNPDEAHSPMKNLLNKKKTKDRCLIFYTYNSPCTVTCLNKGRERNILETLKKVFSKLKDPKAFVYNKIFRYDKKNPDLEKYLKKVDDNIQLYRCYSPPPEAESRDRSRKPIHSHISYECHRCFDSGAVAPQCVNNDV